MIVTSAGGSWRCASAHASGQAEPGAAAATRSQARAWTGETGTASYYGFKEDGRRSASGVPFDMRLMTAAHPWLPFGTKVRVTLGDTGRSVVVTVTDRLRSSRRIVDLSVAAAERLGMIRRGVATVTLAPA